MHWYRCCIVSGTRPQHGQRLVVVCPRLYRIIMVEKVLLVNFVMNYAMWKVVLPHARLNAMRSIPSWSIMLFRFQSVHY